MNLVLVSNFFELQAFRVSFDYKWSLRDLEYGTEEYNTVMKEVWKQLLVKKFP